MAIPRRLRLRYEIRRAFRVIWAAKAPIYVFFYTSASPIYISMVRCKSISPRKIKDREQKAL